jgi:hypothetical protein
MTASISTDSSHESANKVACQRLGPVRRFPGFWIFMCLLSLPGCSGCQKITTKTPEKPETVTAPPADPASDAKPISKPAESDNTSDSNGQSSSTNGNTTPGAPGTGSKPGGSGGGPKVGAGPRPAEETKSSTAARKPGSQPQTADAALKVAQSLQQKSAAAEKRGDYGKAYDWASQAWEAVHNFPHDAECKTLTSQLETQLESLGDRANALASPGAGNTKRLVDQ